MSIITLLTDFGLQDEYVGVLKGVILSTAPEATIVDICHGVEAQDVNAAARTLCASYPYFPERTVHVAIVDPGVGTQRNIIAALCDGHLFLAPDNGLLAPILEKGSSVNIYAVENDSLFKHPISRTFHGRDIFAPVAAILSQGLALKTLGPHVALDRIKSLKDQAFRQLNAKTIEGQIVAVDRFGNLITNINSTAIAQLDCERFSFILGDVIIDGVSQSYAQSESGEPIAVMGSRDYIEIAIGCENAANVLKVGKGDTIQVICTN